MGKRCPPLIWPNWGKILEGNWENGRMGRVNEEERIENG